MMKLLFLLLILSFTGCRLGPKYEKPTPAVPEEWKHGKALADLPANMLGPWWSVFNDASLDYFEELAISANPNLFAALDRVAQARAAAGVKYSHLYPSVNLLPGYTSTGTLFKIYLPPGGIPGIDFLQNSYRVHELAYSMPFTMQYEIDLWGKLAGQYDSAKYYAEVQMENFKAALLTLTTDVAMAYFAARTFDAQIQNYENEMEILKENVELVSKRYAKGLVSLLDVASAKGQLATTCASYYDAIRQRALQEDALAMLIGVAPSEFCLEQSPLIEEPPTIPSGLPSDLLVQRPDITAAEREMASMHALIGVAYASFFPSIELTGTLGFFSPQLNDFMRWKSRLWLLGVQGAQSIFDAGRNRSNLQLSYAQFSEALNQYSGTVLKAFQETEDALVNLEMQQASYNSYLEALQNNAIREKLARRRYGQGLVGYLEVIEGEKAYIETNASVSAALGARYASTVQLIKALGGSW